MAPQKLGFSAPKPVGEDETTLLHTGDMAMNEHDSRTTEVEDGMGKEKYRILTGESADLGHPSKLGFDGAISRSSHGEHKDSPFPMAEFLRLANAVVDDGDETSKKALMELKRKWETKYGDQSLHRQTLSLLLTSDAPPLVQGFCQDFRRVLMPAKRGMMVETDGKIKAAKSTIFPAENQNTDGNGLLPAAEQFFGDLLPKTDSPTMVTDLAGVDDEAAKVAKIAADVVVVGDWDGDLAVNEADDVDGDVTDDARMTSADIMAYPTDDITVDAGMVF
ncbi:UNVERIFIED_CONTAM: hypothetical protein Sindi_1299500 [Sesamum indicum]